MTFTASNGVEIIGQLEIELGIERRKIGNAILRSTPEEFEALREFFQHERDQELGRWRWPENPEVVVVPDTEEYHNDGKRWVAVYDERKMGYSSWYCSEFSDPGHRGSQPLHDAAHDYFAAHPEPKPWHDAKPGEVWELERRAEIAAWGVVERVVNPNTFVDPQARRPSFPVTDEQITSGRRIWPEVSDA